jgi:hypothetical protein
MLMWLFFESVKSFTDPESSYLGSTWLGVAPPLVIGVGLLVLGFVLLVLWRLGGHPEYFGRKGLESVDPDVAAGRVKVQAEEI